MKTQAVALNQKCSILVILAIPNCVTVIVHMCVFQGVTITAIVTPEARGICN